MSKKRNRNLFEDVIGDTIVEPERNTVVDVESLRTGGDVDCRRRRPHDFLEFRDDYPLIQFAGHRISFPRGSESSQFALKRAILKAKIRTRGRRWWLRASWKLTKSFWFSIEGKFGKKVFGSLRIY